jgi:hypothetical protein
MLHLATETTFGDRRCVGALVEEHQGTTVETETIEVFRELFQPLVEQISILVATDLELSRETLHSACWQGPAHQQVEAATPDGILTVDGCHPGGTGLDLGAAIDHPMQPR